MTDERKDRASSAWTRMSGVDVNRLSLLLIAAGELSQGGYVLMRYASREDAPKDEAQLDQWRVNVRFAGMERTTRATVPRRGRHGPQKWQALLLALDRAVQWLRGCEARFQVTRAEELRAWTAKPKEPPK